MIEIRPMTKEDVSAVAAIESSAFSEPWSAQAFCDALDQKTYCYMVAEEEHEVIAYCGMYVVLDEGNITQVAVREDKRRAGVARTLLAEFMECGAAFGVASYTLEVRVSNTRAIALYEACGFAIESVRKNFYTSPAEDAYIMWKR